MSFQSRKPKLGAYWNASQVCDSFGDAREKWILHSEKEWA